MQEENPPETFRVKRLRFIESHRDEQGRLISRSCRPVVLFHYLFSAMPYGSLDTCDTPYGSHSFGLGFAELVRQIYGKGVSNLVRQMGNTLSMYGEKTEILLVRFQHFPDMPQRICPMPTFHEVKR
jgi:hypothetical protein